MPSCPSHKKLFTYWFTLLIYDRTVIFCKKHIKSWKLKEQITGAARSGKQNIVEGTQALPTSLKSAIKLTNVAKASIEELIEDLEDFLRQRNLKKLDKDDPAIRKYRAQSSRVVKTISNLSVLGKEKEANNLAKTTLPLPENPEEATNLLLTLCHQAAYLLGKQVKSLEKKHKTEGGYSEKLYRKRKKHRGF